MEGDGMFKAVGAMVAVWFVVWIAIVIGLIYVAVHFLGKVW